MAETLNYNKIRRKSHAVQIGGVIVGGTAPIVVQSMTDTDTANVQATAKQIAALAQVGSELVRVTVNTEEAAAAIPEIVEACAKMNVFVPIIGDFHYNGHRLLKKYPECARALAKYRINPGNVGFADKRDTQFAEMIEIALENNKPVRIGVNWGSLDQAVLQQLMDANAGVAAPKSGQAILRDALVLSAIQSAEMAQQLGMSANQIILSCKVSSVQDTILVHQQLAEQCDYAIHLGLTEAGLGSKGIVATTAALSYLLQQGIGDTIRASLTPVPGAPRTQEVIVCQEILQTVGLRAFTPMVSACPGCGRTTSVYFRTLAEDIQNYVRERMSEWREAYDGVETLTLAVMGCIVNGPGESKHANLGISLPGSGEAPVAPVFADGQKVATLRGDDITSQFKVIIDDYVKRKYPAKAELLLSA